jgi:hypothetical protein
MKLSSIDIVRYITGITPDDSDVPDFFFKKILQSRKYFVKRTVLIEDLLKDDSSLREYVESGEDRYGSFGGDPQSDIEPDPHDIDLPIVIFNGEVVDGYSRVSTHYHNGEKNITAYVSE